MAPSRKAESQGPDVEFHRGQAIQDAVSKGSSAIARRVVPPLIPLIPYARLPIPMTAF